MVLGSEVESPAVRFGLYIDELQEFFSGRALQFGSPDDIFPLGDRLSSPSFFREEMSSMVRAIIYREFEGISRDELLELIAVAGGGPHIDVSDAQFREPVRQILDFLTGVLRSLWKTFPDEFPEDTSAEEPLAVSEPRTAPPENSFTEKPLALPPPVGNQLVSPLPTRIPDSETQPDPEILARAKAALDRASHAEPLPIAAPAVLEVPNARRPLSAITPSPWRRYFWLAAICGILLGLITGLLVRDRGPLLSAPVLDAVQSNDAAENPRPKPSPYELPLRDTRARAAGQSATNTMAASHQALTRSPVAPNPAGHVRGRNVFRPAPQARVEALSQAPAYPSTAEPMAQRSSLEEAIPARKSSVPNSSYEPPAPAPVPAYTYARPSVFLASSGLMTSNLLYAPAPEYPRQASGAGLEGRVVLQALVWRDGTVVATHVLRGDRTLGAAAQDAIRHWRYRPYTADGRATDVATIITVDFRLLH